jgi:hypothetical protein
VALRAAHCQENIMQTSHAARAAALGDTVRAASRQIWLAGLGAAAVTRQWADKEAGNVFRSLVHEGALVESHAKRFVGARLDTSAVRANALWRQARGTLEGAVKGYAGTAVALVRNTLPRALPRLTMPAILRQEQPVTAPRRKSKPQQGATTKRTKRGTKRSVKRANGR